MTIATVGHRVEIVGIDRETEGRSCEDHAICGASLEPGTVLRCRSVHAIGHDDKEPVSLTLFRVSPLTGKDSCKVGYLPKYLKPRWIEYDRLLLVVREIYAEDVEGEKKRKRARNCGYGIATVIGSTPVDTPTSISKDPK